MLVILSRRIGESSDVGDEGAENDDDRGGDGDLDGDDEEDEGDDGRMDGGEEGRSQGSRSFLLFIPLSSSPASLVM